MKTWKLVWGIGFILAAVLIVLDVAGVLSPLASVVGDISILALLLGLLLVCFIITRLVKGKFDQIIFPLAFLFMLFESNIAILCGAANHNLINNWLLLLVALLVQIGVGILCSSRKKHYVARVQTKFNGNKQHKTYAGGSLSSSTVYVNCATMTPNCVENNLGSCTVYFENVEHYSGNGKLFVENNLGAMVICVPVAWQVHTEIENNLGAVNAPRNDATPYSDASLLTVCAENNLGSLTVKYV
ncbi:MAG: hypothetical protein IJW92_02955 [Clostridia bacterium]|nr:hypothetical protein [Clostridia bacterium]